MFILSSCLARTFEVTACTFSEIVTSEWPSRAVPCMNGPTEGLSVGTPARDWNCKVFPVNFHWAFN
jgi:hypothetical protein